ncbi:MAG: VanW family protein [Bacillota bacterium]
MQTIRSRGGWLTVLILVTLFLYGCSLWSAPRSILTGVSIAGVDVGGLSREEAKKRLALWLDDFGSRPMTFITHGEERVVELRQLGVSADLDNTLDQAESIGRRGTLINRAREMWQAYRRGVDITPKILVDESKAAVTFRTLFPGAYREPSDARLDYEGDRVFVVPAVPGQEIDSQEAIGELHQRLPDQWVEPLELPTRDIPPAVPTQQVRSMQVNGLMAKYTTYFNPANAPRSTNIRLAGLALDGKVILPGEIFSFNDTVGPRVPEAGYLEALVIKDRVFIPGQGGGVCQVSSTLYNAVLRANLAIIERKRHSLLVGYVPVGLDATVNYGYIDLKFLNNTQGHVVVRTELGKNALTFRIFGNASSLPPYIHIDGLIDQVIEPPQQVQEDPLLPMGLSVMEQEGTKGYRTTVYRTVKEKGETTKELISKDYYPPVPEKIRMGTAEPAVLPSAE